MTTRHEQTTVTSPRHLEIQAHRHPCGCHSILLGLGQGRPLLRIQGAPGAPYKTLDARALLDLATAALTTAGRLDPDEARHWTPPPEALEAVAYSMYCHGELPQLCDLGENLFWAESADTPGARDRAADDAKACLDGIRDAMRRAAENGPEVAA